jgi:hypothetical protein
LYAVHTQKPGRIKMPNSIVWTADLDRSIADFRASLWSWDRIATKLGLSRFSVIDRGRELDLAERHKKDVSDARCPLPAGSGASWDAICANTSLSGAAFDRATAL